MIHLINKNSKYYKTIKKSINPFRLKKIYNHDFKTFKINSYELNRNKSFNNVRGEITFLYHALEKGMIHKKLRLGYGKEKINRMMDLIDYSIKSNFDLNDDRIQTAVSVLNEYVRLHEKNNYDVSYIKEFLLSRELKKDTFTGGIIEESKENILKYIKGNFEDLSYNRHSIREFTTEPISKELIESAIRIASRTPSVCNRQAWSVTVVKDGSLIKELMKIQSGINGMAENMNTLIAITTSYEYFGNIHERNQAFIDGGLFAMSLLYALTYLGVGTCALNANLRISDEITVKEKLGLSNADNLIMFIAVGHYQENVKYPKSNRDSVTQIVKFI